MSRANFIQSRLDEFESHCRERGLPLTVQRRAILQAVLERDDHPTADQVYDTVKLRLPNVSRTTVYRVLEKLVDCGAVRRFSHHGGVARFDPKTHQHHHLVCLDCGKVIDVEDERLNNLDLPKIRAGGFRVQAYNIDFRGICATCHKKQKAALTASGKKRTAANGRRNVKSKSSTRKRRKK